MDNIRNEFRKPISNIKVVRYATYIIFINVTGPRVGGELEEDVIKQGVEANSVKMTIQKMKRTLMV